MLRSIFHRLFSEQWNAGTQEQKFDRLRAISFSEHDAGIMSFHDWDKLPRYVRAQLITHSEPSGVTTMNVKKLNASFNSETVMTLARLTAQLADRLEHLVRGEDGNIDAADKKLLDAVRKQIQRVQSEPMRRPLSGKELLPGQTRTLERET